MSGDDLGACMPFVTDGLVSLVGSGEKVPVKILQDTGAVDSFTQASVLSFSNESDTGYFIPVRGMYLNVLHVSLYNLIMYSDLFQGQVAVGVRLALLMEATTLVIGNDVAGARVWADVPSPIFGGSSPVVES